MQDAMRAVAGLDGVDILDEPTWNSGVERWVLPCRLTVLPGTVWPLPLRTAWFVLLESRYPAGSVEIHPAKHGGITETFPHQSLNLDGPSDCLWRAGKICVHSGARALGRLGGDPEPLGARDRLRWRLTQALRWVHAASRGILNGPGDPYELPDFDCSRLPAFGFAEDRESLQAWSQISRLAGLAEVCAPSDLTHLLVATSFRDFDSTVVCRAAWGSVFDPSDSGTTGRGLWVRFPAVPHLEPWRPPLTWGELVGCARAVSVDLEGLLERHAKHLRGEQRPLLLCGFPVPARIGEEPAEYFWQALRLPSFTKPGKELRGFRNTEKNRQLLDRLRHFRTDAPLTWVHSENWHPATRAVRGRYSQALVGGQVLLIGAGALGSIVAELLVRGGVEQVVVCDTEHLMLGNLARHALSLGDIGRCKATALAERLNHLSAHARVQALKSSFPPTDNEIELAQNTSLVFDCSGSDEVAAAMSTFKWNKERVFCSVSLDWESRRIFCYLVRGTSFPLADFLSAVHAALKSNPVSQDQLDRAREGVGCWNPVMPARIDSIAMLAGAVTYHLDEALKSAAVVAGLRVFEVQTSPAFIGVRRVS
jgi:hypothetical protein